MIFHRFSSTIFDKFLCLKHGFLNAVEEAFACNADDVEQDVIETMIENLITQKNPKFDGASVFVRQKNLNIKGKISLSTALYNRQREQKNQFTVVVALPVFIYEN